MFCRLLKLIKPRSSNRIRKTHSPLTSSQKKKKNNQILARGGILVLFNAVCWLTGLKCECAAVVSPFEQRIGKKFSSVIFCKCLMQYVILHSHNKKWIKHWNSCFAYQRTMPTVSTWIIIEPFDVYKKDYVFLTCLVLHQQIELLNRIIIELYFTLLFQLHSLYFTHVTMLLKRKIKHWRTGCFIKEFYMVHFRNVKLNQW